MKTLFILRGVPGCGKSTVAEQIAPNGLVCCADDYFMRNGKYEFMPELVFLAHQWCTEKLTNGMKEGVSPIVLANTNTNEQFVEMYREMAIKEGYTPFVLVVENRHNGKNVHGVPEFIVESMERQLASSIRLLPRKEWSGDYEGAEADLF